MKNSGWCYIGRDGKGVIQISSIIGGQFTILVKVIFNGAHKDNLAVKQFVDSKVADQQHIPSTDTTTHPIRVIITFKDQVSANVVKKRLTDLSSKIKTTIQSLFIRRKRNEDLKVREVKPAIVNQQCLVYKV